MEFFLFIITIVLIIVTSGLVSSSEVALLSISYAKVKDLMNSDNKSERIRAKRLLKIKDNLQKHISSIVILNNVINIIGSIYVGYLANELFGEFYLGIVSAILTFLIILFAEIIPKIYGEKYSESLAMSVSKPLLFVTFLLKPLIMFLDIIINIFVKEETRQVVSEGEIKELAAMGHQEGSITEYESEMIQNVFKLDEISVYEIMIPKNEVKFIEYDSTYKQIVKIIGDTGFTRFPIRRDNEIVGIINVKDLFKFFDKQKTFTIDKILRRVIYAPENMKLHSLEEMIKKEKTHMAIVINEHGDFTGVVTLEDVIEEVVGDIEDEFDRKEENFIIKFGKNVYHIDTKINIDDLNDELKINIQDEENSTLNGFLIEEFGKIPVVNSKIRVDNLVFRVLKISKKRIMRVELKINEDDN